MLQRIKESVKTFIENHIVDDHDKYHDPRCFDCNRGSCIEPMVCGVITETFTDEEE